MRGPSLAGGDDGRRLPPHFLVEDALGLRLRQGIPVGYGFDARGVPRGADAWGTVRLDDAVEESVGSGRSDCPLGKANLLLPSADLATVDARVARAADRSGSAGVTRRTGSDQLQQASGSIPTGSAADQIRGGSHSGVRLRASGLTSESGDGPLLGGASACRPSAAGSAAATGRLGLNCSV